MTIATTYKNYTDRWYTPDEWTEWVIATLGTENYFDPCPAHWDGITDGLAGTLWEGPLYCNHPGSRGSVKLWWEKFVNATGPKIWCAFSVEQLRHMYPSCFELAGWLVMPRSRVCFIDARTGELGKSPANWTVFWANVKPAITPIDCLIVETGNH